MRDRTDLTKQLDREAAAIKIAKTRSTKRKLTAVDSLRKRSDDRQYGKGTAGEFTNCSHHQTVLASARRSVRVTGHTFSTTREPIPCRHTGIRHTFAAGSTRHSSSLATTKTNYDRTSSIKSMRSSAATSESAWSTAPPPS